MMRRKINHKVKDLKAYILNIAKDVIEPKVWEEFHNSIENGNNENYTIYDHDLPSIRDLKALINMMTAIERATESYSLIAASVFKTLELPQDILDFHRNYKIYMATNSSLTHYLAYVKDITLATVLPKLISKFNELYALCTSENLAIAGEFFIEQIISLEQYQQKYLQSKRQQEKTSAEDKKDTVERESFVTTLVKQNEFLLKKIYKDKYDIYFPPETKVDPKEVAKTKEKVWDYYQENEKDIDTIKHIKKLSNGLIGIKKVLDDYAGYKQSGMISGMSWMATFIIDLRRAYNSLQEFDYQAIIAEQANPAAEFVKNQLQQLNGSLEKLACIADQFEYERCLKEGTLLKHVDLLIKRYDQITSELRIPIEYVSQKRIFYKSRQRARETYSLDIDVQLNELYFLIRFKEHALRDIPIQTLQALQAFIHKYDDEICMDRDRLTKYKQYLADAQTPKAGSRAYIAKQFEYLGNFCGFTIHYELMNALKNRILYLEKQKTLLNQKIQQSLKLTEENPYDNFNLNDMKNASHHQLILTTLKKRVDELCVEKENLILSTCPLKEEKETKEPKEAKEKIKSIEMSERLTNQIITKVRELGIFSLASEKYEKDNNFPPLLELMRKEESLSPKSLILLHELEEILKTPEQKSVKL